MTHLPPEVVASASFIPVAPDSTPRHDPALPASRTTPPDLVPARMLNEFVYCPRLGYLMWTDAEWADSHDTVEGRYAHRRVDQEAGAVPLAAEAEERIHARSVWLSAPGERLTAKIDLLEGEGACVTPIDYKKGVTPDVPGGAYEPERVQLAAQALVLRENGYTVDTAMLYYVASKTRVPVPIDEALVARTRQALEQFVAVSALAEAPLPLVDSPKCPRCSLVGICLPDEVGLLRREAALTDDDVRRLVPGRDDAVPLYVQRHDVRIGKDGDVLQIKDKTSVLDQVRLQDVSQVSIYGNAQISTQAVHALLERDIPLCYFSGGGWFQGLTQSHGHKNVLLRLRQYDAAREPDRALALAKRFVQGKILNCRTLLRRNAEGLPANALADLARMAGRAGRCKLAEELLGVEGTAGRFYWEHFGRMLKPLAGQEWAFDLHGRNRRPPRDPVNALLSFGYSLLAKDWTLTLQAVGFDPYLGFFHTPRYGRPALALDLMEEFRPLIVDSVVVTAINTGVVQADDFVHRAGACALKQAPRGRFIEAYERRMDQLVTHPIFGYRIGYRRILEVQARLLGRFLAGEIPRYPMFRTR
jgi:CRISPR-associated protein Cas1